MSEFNPFSAAHQEAVPEYVPVEETEETGGDSRRTVLAVGALAALALGAGAFLFLGGGGEEDLEDFTVAKGVPQAAPVAAAAGPSTKLPTTANLTLGRNPFRALYVQPAAETAPATGTAPTGTTPVTTGGTTPVVVVDGAAPAPAAPPPAPAQPVTAPVQPAPAPAQSTVALKSVAAGEDGAHPTATFDYDGQEVSGKPGDVMAGKLLVISIQQDSTGGWFVNLQLGDGVPFEVHERQRVLVS